ncbi:hypothetical protein C5L14_25465 [Labrys okinawensis]|uniref:Uncharacterized protein n=1 Tax=Labrys okinawensis TaxID=346911 RepID=A0A2S9Q6A1_9HYPH|nr:hypothetical protein [Labrys okinawensis]PRH84879.1 hypothetical protein C5L14_25465 [Labrys okinawensis]
MVEIISKRDGPRREDAAFRRLLSENRSTITRLADQFSAGAYSASKAAKPKPQPQGLIFHDMGTGAPPREPLPRIRVSLNGRVIVVDENTSRQLHHLGQVTARDGSETFVLATSENGFFAPLDEPIATRLADLDNQTLSGDRMEEWLVAEIGRRLELE